MKLAKQEAITRILPLRPLVQKQLDIQVRPNLHAKLYHGFRECRVLQWQTCNKVLK